MSKASAILIVWISLLCITSSSAQSDFVYRVHFSDKVGTNGDINTPTTLLSSRALQNRAQNNISIDSLDLPVSDVYMDSIISLTSADIHGSSRWLNCGYFITDDSTTFLQQISNLTFVDSVKRIAFYPNGYGLAMDTSDLDETVLDADEEVNESQKTYNYGNGISPIVLHNAKSLHERDYTGNGTLIAVLDNGFEDVNTNICTAHLYSSNRIVATKNYVRPSMDVYSTGFHGTTVLNIMAAEQPNQLVGTAPDASYLLLVTEDSRTEQLIELENWVMAAEYADSLGAQVLNSSLGYNTFNNSADNFDTMQLDGKSNSASIAATIAARKGMIVVTSAGNEAGNSWGKILIPADADSILSVGTVDAQKNYAPLSGIGPSADGRIKPDVVSLGTGIYTISRNNQLQQTSGSSLSTPVIAGLSACLIQVDKTVSSYQYVQLIREYSHLFSQPESTRGYGVPDFGLLVELLNIPPVLLPSDLVLLYPNPSNGKSIQVEVPSSYKSIEYLLLDATGKIITQKAVDHNAFSVSAPEASGFYTLIIKTEQGLFAKNIIQN